MMGTSRAGVVMHLTPHTSHSHTSHLTPHTSHLTPHTSHLTPHTSHLTPHTHTSQGFEMRVLMGAGNMSRVAKVGCVTCDV
jgi:hypothetical protein